MACGRNPNTTASIIITPDWNAIVMYQNTAYWTSIEPNRLTVCPPRKAPTCRRQCGSGVGGSGVGAIERQGLGRDGSAAASGSTDTVQGYRPSETRAIPPRRPDLVSWRFPVDTIRGMAHTDPVHRARAPFDLPSLDAAVIDCFACPRLVAWREEQARVKVARFRDDDVLGAARAGVRGSGGRRS